MTSSEYVEALGEVYAGCGHPPLEGRLVGLLLVRGEAVSLGEASLTLGVSKAALSKLAKAMMTAGDLKGTRRHSTREHLYDLAGSAYLSDLRERLAQSRRLAELCARIEGGRLPPSSAARLRAMADLHGSAAASLEALLAPAEARRALDQRRHEDDWDALPARPVRGEARPG